MIRSFMRKAQLTTKGGCLATGAPNQPGGLTATGGVGTISLSWTADSTAAPNQATYYEVERSNDGLGSWSVIATNLTTNSHTDTVAASTSRHYRVYAYNCDSGSLASTSASATTAPAAPSSLTATATSSTQINLAWTDNSSDETGFIIQQRSPSGSGSWSTIHTTGAGATSYSVTGLTASTSYGFRVAATRTSPSATSDYTAEASATTQAGVSTYNVEYLVIAGGGSGSIGGGGAGGYKTASGFSLTVGNSYTVTVGAGGSAPANGLTAGGDGNNSVFSTVTATGGGGGGRFAATAYDGRAGGSGGGGGGLDPQGTPVGAGGLGTSGEGNDGGAGFSGSSGFGGGGGANAVGGTATANTGGNGGAGTSSSISGSSVTRAGGGGGSGGNTRGSGGSGGGGQGGQTSGATAGSANTGGGGGGGWTTSAPGAGGSGVVILRIPTANYSGTYTNATETTDGSFKVLVFNSSGSYTG
jgi:hypothetical protein